MDKILKLLNTDARLTTEQMAVMLNMTEAEVAAAVAQLEQEGVAVLDMGFPTRYTHTPIEVCDVQDIRQLAEVVAQMLHKLDASFSLNRYDI